MDEIVIPVYVVTFNVKNESGAAIEGASVVIEGVTYFTGANGSVEVANLVDGTYSYTVSEEQYNNITASVTVSGSNVTEDVALSVMVLAGTVIISNDGSPQFGELLTADVSGITNNSGTLAYQWARTGSSFNSSTRFVFNIKCYNINWYYNFIHCNWFCYI